MPVTQTDLDLLASANVNATRLSSYLATLLADADPAVMSAIHEARRATANLILAIANLRGRVDDAADPAPELALGTARHGIVGPGFRVRPARRAIPVIPAVDLEITVEVDDDRRTVDFDVGDRTRTVAIPAERMSQLIERGRR